MQTLQTDLKSEKREHIAAIQALNHEFKYHTETENNQNYECVII